MRSMSAWLRTLPAEELDELVAARPDARRYRDPSCTGLARWLAHPVSVQTAMSRLDRFALQLLEVCAALGTDGEVQRSELAAAVGDLATPEQVAEGLRRLQRLALVWPDAKALRVVDLTYVLTPRPLGLGGDLSRGLARHDAATVKAIADRVGLGQLSSKAKAVDALLAHHSDPAALARLLAGAPAPARTLLQRLDEGTGLQARPGSGYYGAPRRSSVAGLEWLLQHGLLVPLDWSSLEVPREVTRALRGGRLVRALDPERPRPAVGPAPDAARIAPVASAAAARLLDSATALADLVDARPLARLKDGGVGVRELRRLGAALGRDESQVTALLTLLGAAGLLDPDDEVRLDRTYDAWARREPAQRYAVLVRAWLALRQPLAVPKPNGGLVPALVPVQLHPPVRLPALKRSLLEPHDGAAPRAADLVRRLQWDRPLELATGTSYVLTLVLEEAELLGLLALGTLTGAGRGVLRDAPADDLGVAGWFPPPVGDVLLQADLTAVVPGPPAAALRSLLDAAADRESQGAAGTWRFGPASVRRALDSGLTAADLLGRLKEHARHGVPQTLEYLVHDVERQHGRLRIGAAGCYLRCADPALAQEVLRVRTAGRLGLREVVPGVLVAAADPATTLAALQAAGYAPVLEDASGEQVLQRVGAERGRGGAWLAERLTWDGG
jgi:hypothetical protein